MSRASGLHFASSETACSKMEKDAMWKHRGWPESRLWLGVALVVFLVCASGAAGAEKILFHHDWYVLGPFPNEGGKGFTAAYPPEKGVDLEASYSGAGGAKIKWTRILEPGSPAAGEGPVDLLRHVRPNNNVCAYAYTTIQSPQARSATLLAGGDDTITVWLNGKRVISQGGSRTAVPDEFRAAVQLKKGLNTVLVKVCQAQRGWEFYFRAAGPTPEQVAKRYTLQNDSLRLKFDYLGRVVEIFNKAAGTACMASGSQDRPAPTFMIDAYSA